MGHTEGEGPVQTEVEMGRCRQESRSTKIAGSCQRSAGKESVCRAGDLGLIPGSGRSPGEGKGNPLQCCGLENSVDYIVHGVAKSMGSDTTERLSLHSLEIRKQGGGVVVVGGAQNSFSAPLPRGPSPAHTCILPRDADSRFPVSRMGRERNFCCLKPPLPLRTQFVVIYMAATGKERDVTLESLPLLQGHLRVSDERRGQSAGV